MMGAALASDICTLGDVARVAVVRTKRIYDSMLLCGQRNIFVDSLGKCNIGLQSQSNRTAENVCLLSMYWNICVVMICTLRLIQTGAAVYKMNM